MKVSSVGACLRRLREGSDHSHWLTARSSYPAVSVPFALFLLMLLLFSWCGRIPLLPFFGAGISFAIMSIPGICLLHDRLPSKDSGLSTIVFGSILGLTLTRFLIVILSLRFPVSTAALITLIAAFLFSLSLLLRGSLPFSITPQDVRDCQWTLWFLALVLIPITLAYWSVGALTSRGYVFVSYFNHDFLQHASITAELTRSIPPENPFFAGELLHYYWFYHVWPAILVLLTGVSARDALGATVPFTATLFIAALALITRDFGRQGARFLSLGFAFLAPSYIGLIASAQYLTPSLIDALPRQYTSTYSLLSHSWLRDCLYEPQALTALTMLLFSYYLHHRCQYQPSIAGRFFIGAVLGSLLLTDAFIAAIGIVSFTLVNASENLSAGRRRSLLLHSGLTMLAFLIVALFVLSLGAIPLNHASVQLRLHPIAVLGPIYLAIEYGPVFLLGCGGILLAGHRTEAGKRAWLILLAIGLIFAFSLAVPIDPNTALRKALKVAEIPLVIFAVPAIEALFAHGLTSRLGLLGVLAILLGCVTTATDLLHYALPAYAGSSATYVGPAEMKVLEWVRLCTPRDATIQDVAEVRPTRDFKDTFYSMLAALGERRTLWGSYHQPYIMQVPGEKIAARLSALRGLFQANDSTALQTILSRLHIDFLYHDSEQPGPHLAVYGLRDAGILREMKCLSSICIFKVVSHDGRTVPCPD